MKSLGAEVDPSMADRLGRVLQLIEESFPIYDACNRLSRDKTPPELAWTDDRILAYASQLWAVQRSDDVEPAEFVAILQYTEPFCLATNPEATLMKATEA